MVSYQQPLLLIALLLLAQFCSLASGAQPTRLRITNGCSQGMWIFMLYASGQTVNAPNQIKLAPNEYYDYPIPDAGLNSARWWPGLECDATGNDCLIGQSGGPPSDGFTCPSVGCAPPVDSKFEATFAGPGGEDYWDISLVDGYTLPYRVDVIGSCPSGPANNLIDCSHLSLDLCPTTEDLSTDGEFPSLVNQDLKLFYPGTRKQVGCYAPCSKLTYVHWTNSSYSPSDPEAEMYCCPTPPISAAQCQAGPGASTDFVNIVHKNCPQTYAYAYDDDVGNWNCPYGAKYHVTFYCPFQSSPKGRGIVTLSSDTKGDVHQLDAATLTTNNVALVWTQPKAWTSSTERSQLNGYVVKPANTPKQVVQTTGGPFDGTSDEEYVRVARVSENRFVMAWEDQLRGTDGKRVDTVFVQSFSGTTGASLRPIFKWDTTQKKYKPDIAYVASTQVVVVYEVATATDTKVKMIRLRISATGALAAVGASAVVAAGTNPHVQRTSAGGFFVTYTGTDHKTYLRTYNKLNELLVGPVVISGADDVAYLSTNSRIVVVWEAGQKVYYRMYASATGVAKTVRMNANDDDSSSIQTNPSVTSLSGGGFMITWQQKATSTSDFDIMASQFTSTGQRVGGSPFAVHSEKTAGQQTRPTVTEIDGGAVLFAWNQQNLASAVTSRVQYQIFDLSS